MKQFGCNCPSQDMEMKNIRCHTNLDLFNEEWPRELPEIPREGEEIESMTEHGGFRLSLRVVSVRWRYTHTGYFPSIELHDPVSRSINDFQKWYRSMVK